MAYGQAGSILRHIRTILDTQASRGLTDSQLLERFVSRRDESAFGVLMQRHGRLAWSVCRNILHREQDAEDAFQATFLVLARRAASIRKGESVGSWLYGVAHRVAMKAKKTAAKRWRYERDATTKKREATSSELALRELQAVLHEELERLPEKYRTPFVLCCLEGRSRKEVADELGWKEGTVSSRIAQARQQLQRRLARRGLALSAILCATAVVPNAASAALVAKTIREVFMFLGGRGEAVSTPAAALAEGVMKAMALSKLKIGTVLVLGMTMIAAGAGLSANQAFQGQPQATPSIEPQRPAVAAAEKPADFTRRLAARTDLHGDFLPEGAILRLGSARLRHGGAIRASALSPDGKMLATAGDHSVIVWNLDTGKARHRFRCDRGSTFCGPGLTFSPDGRLLGYARNDFFACVWDLETGKEMRRFDRRFEDGLGKFWGACCQCANEGKEFVLASREAIETWNVQSGTQTTSVAVNMAALLSPDGKTYLRIEGKGVVILGDARTGKEGTRLEVAAKHDGIENGLAFSPDGKTLAIVHDGQEIQLRATTGGKVLASFSLPDSAQRKIPGNEQYWEYRVTFSTDGKTLLLGTSGGLIHRWDLTAGKEQPPLSKHHCAVAGMHTLPDVRTLVSTGADGVIRRWDLKTGREDAEPDSYEGRSNAAYSLDGRFVVIGDTRGRIDLWDARSGKLVRTLQREGAAVAYLAFAPNGKLVATAERSGTVRLWQMPSGRPGTVWQRQPGPGEWNCNGIHFSPDGRLLCVSDYPKQIRGIEVASGKELWKAGCSYGEVFSPDGATLLIGAPAGPYLTMLDATTGKQRSRVRTNLDIPDNLGVMWTFAFSPDARRLAVACDGGTLMLCDGHTCAEIRRLADHDLKREDIKVLMGGKRANQIRALAFSPDGKWFASAGSDTSVYIWETATGKEVLCLPGHEAEVSCVAFSPDGQTVFSYGQDGQGYLWNLKPKPAAGARAAMNELWTDLAEANASKAYRAIWALSDDPRAVGFLRKNLSPAVRPDKAHVAKLIAELDSNQFAVRESAEKELKKLAEFAGPACRKALEQKPSVEARRRLESLLEKQSQESRNPSSDRLQTLRAVEVLEHIGGPEAKQVLEALAKGAPEAQLTQEAKASLERLGKGSPTSD
jgi:RNA polymerase sigma factor (sigma-70 family)